MTQVKDTLPLSYLQDLGAAMAGGPKPHIKNYVHALDFSASSMDYSMGTRCKFGTTGLTDANYRHGTNKNVYDFCRKVVS